MNWFLFVVIIVGLALVAVLRNADETDQPAPIAPAESVEQPAAEIAPAELPVVEIAPAASPAAELAPAELPAVELAVSAAPDEVAFAPVSPHAVQRYIEHAHSAAAESESYLSNLGNSVCCQARGF